MAYNKSSIWHKRNIIMLWEHYYNDLTLDDFIKFYKNVQIEEPHWYGIVMTSYLYESLQSELDLIVTYSFDDLISWYGLHVLIFDEYCNAYNIQCAVVDENTYYEICKVKNVQYCRAKIKGIDDEIN